jgi:hypothetical protein
VVIGDGSSGTWHFGSINPATGAFTAINDQAGSGNWQGLAFVPATGLIYATNLSAAGGTLLSVTPSGAITTIGATSEDFSALDYDSNDGIMHATQGSSLYTLNLSNGAATRVGSLGISNGLVGMAYNDATNTLYLNVGAGANTHYTVNVATGDATHVGSNGAIPFNGIDGIAFLGTVTAVPEPSTLVPALSCIVLGLCVAWRKRRCGSG